MPTPPVIVVPGITASYLRDEYPLPPEIVWSVLRKDYRRAALHPDNLRYEAVEPARVEPDQLFEVAYEELVEELRYNLASDETEPIPVYPFSYDWRQPLETVEGQLLGFIGEVIERTKLLRHYHAAGYSDDPKVNLVGHSMGGLVIAGCLQRHRKKARVEKVATLATPFRGSFEAVVKITTGTANLGTSPPSSREREAARMTPALYYLLPTVRNGLVVRGLPEDIFDPSLWQRSILATITRYVVDHGLRVRQTNAQARAAARALFHAMLDQAGAHRRRIEGFRLRAAGLTAGDWLCVAGVDAETRVRLQVRKRGNFGEFVFSSGDRRNDWGAQVADDRVQTGDGTVPFEGAVPGFLSRDNLVCVSPDDYGYWELQDRALTRVGGFHGILPSMNMLHRLIVQHFTGAGARYRNTWGRRAPGVANWRPPIPGLREE